VNDRILQFQFLKETKQRVDKYLVEQLPEYSRSRLQGLIEGGFVEVDGSPARKAGQILETNQKITVRIPPIASTDLVAENIPLNVLFENEDLLVVNKPAGMVVHPAAGHSSGTLINAVLGYDPDMEGIGGEERPGLVHRLDKGTSGLILLAKNDRAQSWLQDQFRLRKVDKTYIALVDGKPPTPTGRVEAALGRDRSHRKKMAIMPGGRGRAATSVYKTLVSFREHTLLEIHPLTGRTHQIRLHCAFLGCPIVGDTLYGRKKPSLEIDHPFLHAFRLIIILPQEKQASIFEAPLAEELEKIIELLRNKQ
jgi:23S rRNA pseudouridine1911/1915/1917 synthase